MKQMGKAGHTRLPAVSVDKRCMPNACIAFAPAEGTAAGGGHTQCADGPRARAVNGAPLLRVADCVDVTYLAPVALKPEDGAAEYGSAVLEWESGPDADCTADAIVAALLEEQGAPAAVGAAEAARRCAAHF